MVRVNFTWILAAMAAVTLTLWIGAQSAQHQAHQAQERFYETQQRVEQIAQLRRDWEQNRAARNRIERLLASERYTEAGRTVKDGDGIRAELNDLDASALNGLLRPLLQSPIPLRQLEIERQEKSRVFVKLEIAP